MGNDRMGNRQPKTVFGRIATIARNSVDNIRRKDLHWLLPILALSMLPSFVEDAQWIISGENILAGVINLSLTATVLFAVFRNRLFGGILFVGLLSIGLLLPYPVGASLVFSIFAILTMLSYQNATVGLISLAIIMTAESLSSQLYDHGELFNSGAILTLTGFYCSAWLCGIALRGKEQRDALAQALRQTQRDADMARTLHDQAANAMSDIIIIIHQMQRRKTSDDAQNDEQSNNDLDNIESRARDALIQIRNIIVMLEHHSSNENNAEGSQQNLEDSLQRVIDQHQRFLQAYGCTGYIRVQENPFACQTQQHARLLIDLIDEIFSNTFKHASWNDGYVLIVGSNPTALTLSFSDTPRSRNTADQNRTQELSFGTGLERYRQRVKEARGIWTIDVTDRLWSLTVSLPSSEEGNPSHLHRTASQGGQGRR